MVDPIRFDFVVLAINDEESLQARKVLKIETDNKEASLDYYWGYIPREDGHHLTVGLVPFNDNLGIAEAVQKTDEILRVLRPDYLLILGTAGCLQGPAGTARDDPEIKPGDLFVSYIVQYGTFKAADKNSHRAIPVLPPNEELYDRAYKIAEQGKWTKKLSLDPPDRGKKIKVIFKELASTDKVLGHEELTEVEVLRSHFPRIMAVDMEAGGVAKTLLSLLNLVAHGI